MTDFLPKDYDKQKEKEDSKKSNSEGYMRFEEGENRFRILTEPTIGWVWWTDSNDVIVEKGSKAQKGNKPVRIDMNTNMVAEQFENAKLFWAMQVWNYDKEIAQILEVTQITIRDEIQALIKDKDWGDPREYDLVVERTNDDIVKYSVRPKPHKPFTAKGKEIPNINLKALFDSEDPYKFELKDENIDLDEIDLGEINGGL